MARNTYHFNPVRGLVAGLPVSEGVPTSYGNGTVHPPHVKCGDAFLRFNSEDLPQFQDVDGQKWVVSAAVTRFNPADGRSPYKVLSGQNGPGNLVLVEMQMLDPRLRVKKDKLAWLEAWRGMKIDHGVKTVFSGTDASLFVFSQEGQTVDVYVGNGAVYRLRQERGSIVVVPLSRKDMVELRVAQFTEQLEGLKDDDRRKEGILWSAHRLLTVAISEPDDVREILIDFFVDNRARMSDKLCQQVRSQLLRVNHLSAGNFVVGYGDNVVQLRTEKSTSSQQDRMEIDRKKRDRQIRDRNLRESMRGSSNGGGQSKKAGQKR